MDRIGGKMNVIFITVGNRDIKFKRSFINDIIRENKVDEFFPEFNGEKTLRGISEFLYKNIDKYSEFISFPIITPFINELKRNDNICNKDKVFLVATDQTNEKYNRLDTIYIAKIIKKMFFNKFNLNLHVQFIVATKNVSDADLSYDFFNDEIEKLKLPENSNVIFLPVGGIPALNTALTFNLIARFKDKAFQYRVDEKTSSVIPIKLNNKFLSEFEKYNIEKLAKNYFFASIKESSSNEVIRELADYAYQRINLNLEQAREILSKLKEKSIREEILNYNFDQEQKEIEENKKKKIIEIFWGAYIKIKQKQYVDALLRLYNFTDNLLFDKIVELYHLDTKDLKNNNFSEWWSNYVIDKIKSDNTNIENELRKDDRSIAKLNYNGLPLYDALIRYKTKNDKILEISKPLIEISGLRNKSIAAHGLNSVTIEKINEKLEKYDLDLGSLLLKVENYLEVSFQNSIYEKIVNLISRSLK